MKATLVVVSCARPGNLPVLVEAALKIPDFQEIIVWHQGGLPLDCAGWQDSRIRVIEHHENLYLWGRYAAAQLADTDWIATQDDDCVPRNWKNILEHAESHPRVITACLQTGHLLGDGKRRWGDSHELLVGWGGCFRKELIEPAFAPYLLKYGPDQIFHRKADRLFSILLSRPHQVLKADVVQLPHASDGTALYRRKDHLPLTIEARRRALQLLGVKFSESDIHRL